MEENKNSLLGRVILVGEIAKQEFSKKWSLRETFF